MGGWRPDWVLLPVPCDGGVCTAGRPACAGCVAGERAYLADVPDGRWSELAEWKREAWRREALDP